MPNYTSMSKMISKAIDKQSAGAKASGMSPMEEAKLIKLLMRESPESLGFGPSYAKGGATSVKDQILRDRKPTSNIIEGIRRKLAGKGNLTLKEKAAIIMGNSSSGKGGRGKSRRPAGFGMSSSTRKSGTGKTRRPAGFGVSSNTKKATTTGGKAKSAERKSGMIPDTVPQERRTTPEGKMADAAKRGPSSTRKKNTAQTRKPAPKAQSGISPVPKRGNPPPKRPKGMQPKTGKPNTEPRTIAQAKKMGKLYFVDKNGKKKAAVTAEDLKKSGHKSLRAYLNAKGKPAKKGS